MAKSITATLTNIIENPYATVSNARPPYMAFLSFPQPTPPTGYPTPMGLQSPNVPTTAAASIAFELSAVDIAALTPGCTVVFTSGAITPVVLPP